MRATIRLASIQDIFILGQTAIMSVTVNVNRAAATAGKHTVRAATLLIVPIPIEGQMAFANAVNVTPLVRNFDAKLALRYDGTTTI